MKALFPARLTNVLRRLERCPVPVIAAVRGWALAGGLEIVLCCDLVIAGQSAKFGDAHAKYGLLPSGGSSVRLPRRVGTMRAREMMFTGDWFTAAAMRDGGLVSRVVGDDEVDAEASRLADRLASRSPVGLRRMKSLLLRNAELGDRTGSCSRATRTGLARRLGGHARGTGCFPRKTNPPLHRALISRGRYPS